MVQILASNGRKLTLFAAIHRRFGRFHVARGARFDFDKAQHVFVPADQVDLSASGVASGNCAPPSRSQAS